MNGVLVKIWVTVLLVAVGGYGTYTALRLGGYFAPEAKPPEESPRVVVLEAGTKLLPELTDVKLIERSGANFRWSQLEGQPWVANVFFTTCTKECTLVMHQIRGLQEQLPDVRFVSITCDPERDTLEALRTSADNLRADPSRWFFVTGDMRDIRRATEVMFGFPTKRIDHSPYLVLMDAEGRFVEMFNGLSYQGMRELAAKIEQLQSGGDSTTDAAERKGDESTADDGTPGGGTPDNDDAGSATKTATKTATDESISAEAKK